MKYNFSKYILEDIIESFIDYRGKTPIKTKEGIPLITAKIVKNGRLEPIQEYISVNNYDSWMTRGIPKKGSIILTTEAPLGEIAQLKTSEKVAFAQRVIVLYGKEDVVDNDFLKYYFQSRIFQHKLVERETGTTVTGIKSKELKKIEISIPSDITVQKKTANILSNIDNKIELNNQMIDTLEEMASTLFKRWFVDFEFPDENGNTYKSSGGKMIESELGEIPEKFIIKKLQEVVEVKYGKDHKKLSEGNYPVYGSGGLMRKVDGCLYTGESVLIPRKGSLNNIMYVNESFWTVDTMFFTKMKIGNLAKYIYLTLIRIDFSSMNVGSAVPSMTTAILNDLPVILPSIEVLNEFEYRISPLFLQKKSLEFENKKLSDLRDTLLPKLLSGEIEL